MSIAKLFEIAYPIVQAPMAGADNAEFVAAASNAGILGSLGAQYRTPQEITEAVRQIRTITTAPFAVNLFALDNAQKPTLDDIERSRRVLLPYYDLFKIEPPSNEEVLFQIDADAQLAAILDERVPVLSFTLGSLSQEWMSAFKSCGTKIIGTATNIQEAKLLEALGVDAITMQGCEAGGHRGTFIGAFENSLIGLNSLLGASGAISVPVIAAGGIMNGAGIASAMILGASGVQMGTAFLTVSECPVHVNYKEAIIRATADDTTITKSFSGGAARGIINQFIREQQSSPLLPFPYHNALTRPIRKAANNIGSIEYTNLWSGQLGALGRRLGIKELVQLLMQELNAVNLVRV